MSTIRTYLRLLRFFSKAPAGPTIARTFASRRAAANNNNNNHNTNHTDTEPDEKDLTAARQWLTKLNSKTITVPRDICEISFSRSGGPGGQNVNNLIWLAETTSEDSGPTLKVPLQSLLPLVPRILHPHLRSSRYYAERTHTLVIQSEESRKQAANVESCYEKLHLLLKTTAEDVIPGETSEEQREKVQKLKKAENEARIKAKKLHSSKKSNRRGNKYDE
ncbi:peptidyl-tRNA hydrolase domain protein [Aspergillus thermomutatus]|uniref:Prokaryotic-type class I peptide chain release factors domain-containing protein n=1 Tax=Aspergillus thermomutatus TaxID=41047 RepID=A0A397GGF3_ASPTH|nr:uncharacterized protein CDV56_101926 [Aspergillus thermomutatus]RHZ48476.1 hypothetical protein CDV56_101926 [Aspergillus thermomutatus]